MQIAQPRKNPIFYTVPDDWVEEREYEFGDTKLRVANRFFHKMENDSRLKHHIIEGVELKGLSVGVYMDLTPDSAEEHLWLLIGFKPVNESLIAWLYEPPHPMHLPRTYLFDDLWIFARGKVLKKWRKHQTQTENDHA